MALDGCGVVCKYILFIFNLIFAVVGIALLGLGLWLRFSNSTRGIFEIQELNSSTFVIGVTVLIVLGSVMLIVVSFGDYGACSEKTCALQVFSGLVAFLAGLEIVIGVLAYSKSDEVGLRIAEFYSSLYALYVSSGGDPAIGVILTFIHNALHCCGVTGVKVIEIAQKTCPKPDGFMEHLVMPNCPLTIATTFDSKASLVMGLFVGTEVLLCFLVLGSGKGPEGSIRLPFIMPEFNEETRLSLSHCTIPGFLSVKESM
ncbi:CD9 antigen isoform X2 [Sphaeramia orbicularis]|uniref:CD9 antigen isoform X2 n=1 Tax=Sphaeramia orbicularis TaxID=375764 RepID=UPI0011815E60|nr:CD9 antigen-like isoform X2 [Sphaeramia orbicularis]